MVGKDSTINKKFPFEIWISVIVLSPLLILLYLSFPNTFDVKISGFIPLYFVILAFFGAFLIPAALLYGFMFTGLMKMKMKETIVKIILALTGISLIFLSFYALTRLLPFDKPSLLDIDFNSFKYIYILAFILLSFFFKPTIQ